MTPAAETAQTVERSAIRKIANGGDYKVAFFAVGALILLSAVLMVALGRRDRVAVAARVPAPVAH